MTCLDDRNTNNSSVRWTNFLWFQCWQALSDFLSALPEL